MTTKVWLGFAIFTGGCAAIAAIVAPSSNAAFKDAASVLSFAGLVAVGIERTIEFFWTLLSQSKGIGGWWPLSEVQQQFATVETQTNEMLTPIFKQVREGLEAAQKEAINDKTKLATVNA